jgi:aspartate aminotransferase-like enzyme
MAGSAQSKEDIQQIPLPNGPDPNGLKEYSVVFTDRTLNHMSAKFKGVMTSLHETFTKVYGAESLVIVPGGGTYGMEAVARQFARDVPVMVVRNGFFSFRWTQIFDAAAGPAEANVYKARPAADEEKPSFAPIPVEEVVAEIHARKPAVVFAPHVETSAGLMLPDDYIRAVGEATRAVGGLFVLDCIASGCMFVNMKDLPIDVIISAPQKGWSAQACAGLVMLNSRALAKLETTESDSFSLDLKKWHGIMKAYLGGGAAYHATMPTDALATLVPAVAEMEAIGYEELKQRQAELGAKVRAVLAEKGYASLAAPGFEAPGVVVVRTSDGAIAGKFGKAGMQIAAGVPLMCDHDTNAISDKFNTFRLGLFGLDKLCNVDRTVKYLEEALDEIASK